MLANNVDSGKIYSVIASIFLLTLCSRYFPIFTTKTIIEAEVNASLMSMTALWAIENSLLIIYKPYLMKNNPHKAKALKHPKATKVSISVEPNSL